MKTQKLQTKDIYLGINYENHRKSMDVSLWSSMYREGTSPTDVLRTSSTNTLRRLKYNVLNTSQSNFLRTFPYILIYNTMWCSILTSWGRLAQMLWGRPHTVECLPPRDVSYRDTEDLLKTSLYGSKSKGEERLRDKDVCTWT